MPKMNSSTPSYSFHGSNSSHSKDSGQGGRTYHVPNYATSYANEKSHLISVTFDEDKGAKKTIVAIVFMFLLLLGYSSCALIQGFQKSFFIFRSPGALEQQELVEPPTHTVEDARPSAAGTTGNPGSESHWVSSVSDGQAGNAGRGVFDGAPAASALYWSGLQGDAHCLAYGTRRYTARLRNAPFWANRTRVCMETAVQINGSNIRSPDQCEVKWPFGAVKGHWNVNFKENDCTPVWGKFTDKGCIKKGSHKRLFRSRLWNVKKGEDRKLLCETAPAYVAGTYRSTPDVCEDKGIWGTYGSWIFEDEKC